MPIVFVDCNETVYAVSLYVQKLLKFERAMRLLLS